MNKVIRSHLFTAERAWGALDITNMNGISVRLHWTDNLTNGISMTVKKSLLSWMVRWKCATKKTAKRKSYCSIQVIFFYAGIGTEHVAHPQGEARILVIEKEDSI